MYTDKGRVHKLVLDSLAAYYRTFAKHSDQEMYEERITSNLEYGAFINLLVGMSKQNFPGFAELISKDATVKDVEAPWATQLADVRSLPSSAFAQVDEGFLLALGARSTTVNQAAFDDLFAKSESLRNYADTVDHDYWLNFPNPSQVQITQRFVFIDSLLQLSESDARSAYLKKIQSNAKNIYPKFAAAVDRGQTIDQIMAPWVAHFADQLELYRGGINPIQERTLILTAITPPSSMAEFDATLTHDPRWLLTKKSKEATAGKPSY